MFTNFQELHDHVEFGFPSMAKIALAVVVLVIGGLGVVVRFVVRRVRRRRAAQAA